MDAEKIKKILKEIGLSPAEMQVYVALLEGSQSVKEVMQVTNEKRPTIYYALNSLEKSGLVSKTGKEYGNKFQVEPIDALLELVNKNIRKQTDLRDRVEHIKNFYPTEKIHNKVLVSHFDNLESIKASIFYSLYTKEKIIRSLVPGNNFFREIGSDFINEYVQEKTKRDIKTKALWEDVPNKTIIGQYYFDSQIKQLPIDMHNSFETTIFIYDDKTLYISPLKENFATVIQSKGHAAMMVSMFENIWSHSIEIKP